MSKPKFTPGPWGEFNSKRQWIDARTKEIFKSMDPKCDRGGCGNHSGHEFCSVDVAWEDAQSIADEEAWRIEEDIIIEEEVSNARGVS